MNKLTWLLVSGLAVCSANAVGKNHTESALSIERIFQSPSLEGSSQKKLQVSPDGKRVTFLQGKKTDYERLDLWEYDIKSGKTQILFDSDDLSSGPEILSDEEKARRERMRLSGSGIIS